MTRMNWGAPCKRWDPETSFARPLPAIDRKPRAPRPSSPPAAAPIDAAGISLSYLAGFGFNRLSAWCPRCRVVAHVAFADLAAEHLDRALEDLGSVLSCPDCATPRAVSAMTEKAVRKG
ncbi:hypothetical protein [Xanthobacter sp. 91]|uniref:hypothetical protein n=1 Tax=Xanthobacter sp. 91 TaxID=1117244 RepID=UPI0012DCCF90|nr:hypothetical protein [Xanthobacter sp. 91]